MIVFASDVAFAPTVAQNDLWVLLPLEPSDSPSC